MSTNGKHTVLSDDIITFNKEHFQKEITGQVLFRYDKSKEFDPNILLVFEGSESFVFSVSDFTDMPSVSKEKLLIRCQITQVL